MDPLDEAQKLLAMEPLPPDAEARLIALRAKADPLDRPFFAGLFEALEVAQSV